MVVWLGRPRRCLAKICRLGDKKLPVVTPLLVWVGSFVFLFFAAPARKHCFVIASFCPVLCEWRVHQVFRIFSNFGGRWPKRLFMAAQTQFNYELAGVAINSRAPGAIILTAHIKNYDAKARRCSQRSIATSDGASA
jgi:hypothetical protein